MMIKANELDYRRQALMRWLATDPDGDHAALLWHMLTKATQTELDEHWCTLENIATVKFGHRSKCANCGGRLHFARLDPKITSACWQCADCKAELHAFDSSADNFVSTTQPSLNTAYPTHGQNRDLRYDALVEVILDPRSGTSEQRRNPPS